MHCPFCGCQMFTVLMDFSTTNSREQILNADDLVTCRGCDREYAIAELEDDTYPEGD